MKKRSFWKALSLALAVTLAAGLALPAGAAEGEMVVSAAEEISAVSKQTDAEKTAFRDVSAGDWYCEAVMEMTDRGIMKGVSDTVFAPNASLTRAMLVTSLWRMAGEPQPAGSGQFTDVAQGSWYEAAVNWASEKGIVDGYGGGLFGPEDPITRQQLASILWRYAQYKGYDVRANGTVMPDFTDRDQIASWAGEAVSWAYSRGIMTGKSGLRLDPTGGATRAEAASMLLRLSNLPTGNSGHVKK